MSSLANPIQSIDTSILKLENISKGYTEKKNKIHSKHTVINKLSLNIKNGEFVTIVGPSGCGKIMLFNLVAGLDNKFDGEILVDDKPIALSPSTGLGGSFSGRSFISLVNSI